MGSEVAANVEYPKSGSEIIPTRKLLLKGERIDFIDLMVI